MVGSRDLGPPHTFSSVETAGGVVSILEKQWGGGTQDDLILLCHRHEQDWALTATTSDIEHEHCGAVCPYPH